MFYSFSSSCCANRKTDDDEKVMMMMMMRSTREEGCSSDDDDVLPVREGNSSCSSFLGKKRRLSLNFFSKKEVPTQEFIFYHKQYENNKRS
jgi:hypothetical protein